MADCRLFADEISIVNTCMCLLPLPKLLGPTDPALHPEQLHRKKNETLRLTLTSYTHACEWMCGLRQPRCP